MSDSLVEKLSNLMDGATTFLWRQFEKDMQMTDAILARVEVLFDVNRPR